MDARDLLARYLAQRAAVGELPVVLPRSARATVPGPTRQAEGRAGGAAPGASARGADPATPRWLRGAPPLPPPGIVIEAPPKDLFSKDPLAGLDLAGLADRIHACTSCRLSASRMHAVPGEGPGDARMVVVGEGPGAVEDETGRPFVGRAGELLTEILAAIDLPRDQVFICNVVKCRPPENRKPSPDECAACVPYLHRQLEIVRPDVILAMGSTAAETLLAVRQPLAVLRNKIHQFRGIPLVVTYHPAALLRNPHWKKPTWDDVRIARQLVRQRD